MPFGAGGGAVFPESATYRPTILFDMVLQLPVHSRELKTRDAPVV